MMFDRSEVFIPSLVLEDKDVLKVMGATGRAANELQAEISEAVEMVKESSIPRAVHRAVRVESIENAGVTFGSGHMISGKFASHLFEGADHAIFVIATLGAELDRKIAHLMKNGENIEAVITDAAGTAAAFNTFTSVLEHLLLQAYSSGQKMGACLRPGQSYWDISGQSVIFEVLKPGEIGVELLESSFMKPQKSQSGIIPVGTSLVIEDDPSKGYCRYCPASKCPMRIEEYYPSDKIGS